MFFLRKLVANLMTNKMFKNITQAQNEALIDCLALAVAIDGRVDPEELREVRDVLKMMDWRGQLGVEDYLRDALERAQSHAIEEAALRVFASDIAQRLDQDWLCDEAYYISARIATADKDIDEQERVMLNALVESLGLTRERLQHITQKLMAETTF